MANIAPAVERFPARTYLFPEQKQDTAITPELYGGTHVGTFSPNIANPRARKYDMILQELSPGEERIAFDLQTVGEQRLREKLVQRRTLNDAETRMMMMREYAEARAMADYAPVTEEEQQTVLQIAQTRDSANPDTIFEEEIARETANAVATVGESGNFFERAVAENNTTALRIIEAFENGIARKELANTWLEQMHSEMMSRGLLRNAMQIGEQFIPFMSMENLMNELEGAPTYGQLLPGNNLLEQINYALSLPLEEYAKVVPQWLEEVKRQNIFDAMHVAEALGGYTSTSQFFDNTLALDWTLPAGVVGKGIAGGVRRTLIGGADDRPLTPRAGSGEAPSATPDAEVIPPARGATEEDFDNALREDVKARWEEFNRIDAEWTNRDEPPPAEWFEAEASLVESVRIAGLPGDSIEAGAREVNGIEDIRAAFANATKEQLDNYWLRPQNASTAAAPLEAAVRAAAEVNNIRNPNVSDYAAAIGDTKVAAVSEIQERAIRAIRERDPTRMFYDIQKDVPSLFNGASDWLRNSRALTRELTERLTRNMQEMGAQLLLVPSRTNNVVRLVQEAAEVAFKKTEQQMTEMYPGIDNMLLDSGVTYKLAEDSITNIGTVTMRLGKNDGTLFKSNQEAEYWLREVLKAPSNSNEWRLRKEKGGDNWVIEWSRDVGEHFDPVRDAFLGTDNVTPHSFANDFLAFLRSPEDTLSKFHRGNRAAATHGSQNLHQYIKEVAQNLALPRKSRKNLLRLLNKNRDLTHPDTGRRGIYYKTVADMEMDYQNTFGRLPSVNEIQAYYNFVQLNDIVYVLRNMALYRDKARMGLENVSFLKGDKFLPNVDARKVDELPLDDVEDLGIGIFDSVSKNFLPFRSHRLSTEDRALIQQKLDAGYGIYHIADPADPTMRKATGYQDTLNFVLAKDVKRTRQSLKQVPRLEGGSVEHSGRSWVKQPVGKNLAKEGEAPRWLYEGDRSALSVTTEAEGIKYAQRMDHARRILKGEINENLDDFLAKNLPYDRQKWESYFKPTVNEKGEVEGPPVFDINTPFFFTKSGERVAEVNDLNKVFPGYRDAVRSKFNLYNQMDKKFMGHRDPALPTIKERPQYGTEADPILTLENPKYFDALTTLGRSVANAVRSRHMNDYKAFSIESFIREYGDLLDVPIKELRRNPALYFDEAPWKRTTDVNVGRMQQAMTMRKNIVRMLGEPGPTMKYINYAKEKLLNSIYNTAGQNMSDMVNEALFHRIGDPFRFARAVAFHSKLGLFNPKQLWMQAQTMSLVTGVAGVEKSMKAVPAAALMQFRGLTEKQAVIDHMADLAAKMGWKREQFIESYEEMKQTGWFHVEGEQAYRDDFLDPKLFQSKVGQVLDAGTFFFKHGERFPRLAAWNAAYLEYRAKNPTKRITAVDRNGILVRARDMTANMTRDSLAGYQHGILSIPTQFFSYQLRLSELLLGKRLTRQEKFRTVAIHAALYGMPIVGSMYIPFFPMREWITKQFQDNGINVDENPAAEAAMDGLYAFILELATGRDYNVAETYGPNGLTIVKEIIRGDKTLYDLMIGPSGAIIGNYIKSVDPVFRSLADAIDPGSTRYPITARDFADVFSEVTTVNNAIRAWYMIQTGDYITKNEVQLTDTPDVIDAVMLAITGLQPQELTEAFLRLESMQDVQNAQSSIRKEVIKQFRRGYQAAQADDWQTADAYWARANTLMKAGGFQPDQMSDIMAEAMHYEPSFVDKINWDHVQQAPMDQYNARLDAYTRGLN